MIVVRLHIHNCYIPLTVGGKQGLTIAYPILGATLTWEIRAVQSWRQDINVLDAQYLNVVTRERCSQ